MRVGYYQTDSLDSHLSLVRQQVTRSLRDPATVQLARRIVSGRYDYAPGMNGLGYASQEPVIQAWGNYYRAPEGPLCRAKDARCEIEAIWDFYVLNVRYTLDPEGIDTFSTVRYTLEAGGGDCDDAVIFFCAMLGALGFKTAARVIAADSNYWEHVYALIGVPKGKGDRWVPLDPTVDGAKPGWEFKGYKAKADYLMVA